MTNLQPLTLLLTQNEPLSYNKGQSIDWLVARGLVYKAELCLVGTVHMALYMRATSFPGFWLLLYECQPYGPGCPLPPPVTHTDLGNSLASRKLCTLGICSPGASVSLSFYLLPFLSRCSAEEVFGDGGGRKRISNLNLSRTCH